MLLGLSIFRVVLKVDCVLSVLIEVFMLCLLVSLRIFLIMLYFLKFSVMLVFILWVILR